MTAKITIGKLYKRHAEVKIETQGYDPLPGEFDIGSPDSSHQMSQPKLSGATDAQKSASIPDAAFAD